MAHGVFSINPSLLTLQYVIASPGNAASVTMCSREPTFPKVFVNELFGNICTVYVQCVY